MTNVTLAPAPTRVSEGGAWKVLEAAANIEHERCDACGHRAYVVTAVLISGDEELPLSWCNHHFNSRGQHSGAVARDTRDTLS